MRQLPPDLPIVSIQETIGVVGGCLYFLNFKDHAMSKTHFSLEEILNSFDDDYLTPTNCLFYIGKGFIYYVSSETFRSCNKAEEEALQIQILFARLGDLFLFLEKSE